MLDTFIQHVECVIDLEKINVLKFIVPLMCINIYNNLKFLMGSSMFLEEFQFTPSDNLFYAVFFAEGDSTMLGIKIGLNELKRISSLSFLN